MKKPSKQNSIVNKEVYKPLTEKEAGFTPIDDLFSAELPDNNDIPKDKHMEKLKELCPKCEVGK